MNRYETCGNIIFNLTASYGAPAKPSRISHYGIHAIEISQSFGPSTSSGGPVIPPKVALAAGGYAPVVSTVPGIVELCKPTSWQADGSRPVSSVQNFLSPAMTTARLRHLSSSVRVSWLVTECSILIPQTGLAFLSRHYTNHQPSRSPTKPAFQPCRCQPSNEPRLLRSM